VSRLPHTVCSQTFAQWPPVDSQIVEPHESAGVLNIWLTVVVGCRVRATTVLRRQSSFLYSIGFI